MAVYDETRREIVVRLVYDGPPSAGKTSSLYSLLEHLPAKVLRQFLSSDPVGTRTQVFDWLEIPRATLKDGPQRLRCQLISVPGQAEFIPRRRALLALADAIVFVTSSCEPDLARSRIAIQDLVALIPKDQRRLAPLGFVLQANKQDLPGALLPAEVARKLNVNPRVPVVGTAASTGEGIHRAFVTALRMAAQRARLLMSSGRIERSRVVLEAQDFYEQLAAAEMLDEQHAEYDQAASGFEDMLHGLQGAATPARPETQVELPASNSLKTELAATLSAQENTEVSQQIREMAVAPQGLERGETLLEAAEPLEPADAIDIPTESSNLDDAQHDRAATIESVPETAASTPVVPEPTPVDLTASADEVSPPAAEIAPQEVETETVVVSAPADEPEPENEEIEAEASDLTEEPVPVESELKAEDDPAQEAKSENDEVDGELSDHATPMETDAESASMPDEPSEVRSEVRLDAPLSNENAVTTQPHELAVADFEATAQRSESVPAQDEPTFPAETEEEEEESLPHAELSPVDMPDEIEEDSSLFSIQDDEEPEYRPTVIRQWRGQVTASSLQPRSGEFAKPPTADLQPPRVSLLPKQEQTSTAPQIIASDENEETKNRLAAPQAEDRAEPQSAAENVDQQPSEVQREIEPIVESEVRPAAPDLERLWAEFPTTAPEAGNAWPPVASRVTLQAILAIAPRNLSNPWQSRGTDLCEYHGKPGWRLLTKPRAWNFPQRDLGRKELIPLVRRCVRLEAFLPAGKTVMLAPTAEGFRLWEMTPEMRTIADRVPALLTDPRRVARRQLIDEIELAVKQLLSAAVDAGVTLDLRLDNIAVAESGPLYLGQIAEATESSLDPQQVISQLQLQLEDQMIDAGASRDHFLAT